MLSDAKARKRYDQHGREVAGQDERQGHPFSDFGFHGHSDFHFQRPEDIFRAFFGDSDPFDHHPFHHPATQSGHHGHHHEPHSRMMHPFDDPFFSSAFSNTSSSSSSFGHFPGMNRSSSSSICSSSSTVVDAQGRQVMTKITSQTQPNGQVTETVEEFVNGKCTKRSTTSSSMRSIGGSGSSKRLGGCR